MSDEKKTDIGAELTRLEKLYEVGDYKQARALARGLLISQTLTDSEKKRIRKVLTATRTDKTAVVAIIVTVLLLMYLYVKYAT